MIEIHETWKTDTELHGGDVIALSCEKWEKIGSVLEQLLDIMTTNETCAICLANCTNCKECALALHDAPCIDGRSCFRRARIALEDAQDASTQVLRLLQILAPDYLPGEDDDET